MKEGPEREVRRKARADTDYRSCEEFIVAMRSLDGSEIKRLGLQARALVGGARLKESDLLSEAICATADGERRWPKDVGISAYLYMTMKSLASNARRKDAQLLHVPVGGDSLGTADPLSKLRDQAPDPEAKAVLADLERRAFALLDGDELAQLLLLSRMEGLGVAEFCEQNGLSTADYEAVTKSLQRKLRPLKAGAKR